jgi:hypothetical protein
MGEGNTRTSPAYQFCGQPSKQRFWVRQWTPHPPTPSTPGKRQGVFQFGVSWEVKRPPTFFEVHMTLILWIVMEMSRVAARPVVAEVEGRPTRVELVRPDDRPTRDIRPRRLD